MEAVDNKYKKWGWGALIGLAAVIIIAGIAIGVSMKSKPVNVVDNGADSTKTVAENGGSNSGNNSANTSEGRDNDADAQNSGSNAGNSDNSGNANAGSNNSSNANSGNANSGSSNANSGANSANTPTNIPKTGPEDDMIAFAAWAAIAGLGAYYYMSVKKNA